MDTQFLLTSTSFSPTAGELDADHDDFINPGLFALQLGDFLECELGKRGYPVRVRCQEDWGHWLELDHPGQFTLAVGCANTGEVIGEASEHLVFIAASKPFIRRLFNKLDVRDEVEALVSALKDTFVKSPLIHDTKLAANAVEAE